jgi:hypothetical protein
MGNKNMPRASTGQVAQYSLEHGKRARILCRHATYTSAQHIHARAGDGRFVDQSGTNETKMKQKRRRQENARACTAQVMEQDGG